MTTRPSCSSGRASSELLGDSRDCFAIGGLTEPENCCAAHADERKAPLDCHRRLRERLRQRDSEALDRLLLGSTPHDRRVRRRPLAEEVALPALGIEQRYLAFRQRSRERNPRRAAARADVDQRPFEPLDKRHGPERVVPQHRARPLGVAQRCQPRRREDGAEVVVSREGRRRSDSAPSPPMRSKHRRLPSSAGG